MKSKHSLLSIKLDEAKLKYSIEQLETPQDIHKIAIANDSNGNPLLYALTQKVGSPSPRIKVATIETLIKNTRKTALLYALQNEKKRKEQKETTQTTTTTLTEVPSY